MSDTDEVSVLSAVIDACIKHLNWLSYEEKEKVKQIADGCP